MKLYMLGWVDDGTSSREEAVEVGRGWDNRYDAVNQFLQDSDEDWNSRWEVRMPCE
jgi:hypothetical protein